MKELTIRLKETHAANKITFIFGGGWMETTGYAMGIVGIAHAVVFYVSQHGFALDLMGAYESVTDLIPFFLILFGTLLTATLQEYIIDGDRHCFVEAQMVWSLRGFSRTTPHEELSCVAIQRVKNATVDHKDWCDIWIEPKADLAPIFYYSGLASEEMESLAQRMATLLDVPLVEKEIDRNNDASD
ncbi:hypothetical protein [Blastopirellula marina]|uniref:Uncharacterized protein n=1 Tax=Blastopirellula marina TaxID=124 RepID=A0A2S8GKC5_9BACT|nr:hypothetical protein [Blastopirellula marina]PQO44893.1 hypothetical protein C5Y93_17535 [Blastopirellula marina]